MTWLMSTVVALVGGRVVTLAGPPIEQGTVVLRDGKIASVAADRNAPPGAQIIDCTGRVVTPGLIAADTHLGLTEISLEASTRDYAMSERQDREDQNHAAFRVADAINPRSTLIPIARLHGVTSTVSAPSGGLIAGQSSWLDLAWPDATTMIANRSVAMHATLGQLGGSRAWSWATLREMLDDARTYQKTRRLFDRNQSRALSGSRLDLEALAPVIAGRLPLVLNVERESDLRTSLAFAREQNVRIVLAGAAEAWRIRSELAAAKVPVLIDPMENLPWTFDSLTSRLDNAALLAQAGVSVGVTLRGESHHARTLRQLAGIAASYGLPHDEALAAVSRNIAIAFGMDDTYGTLEAGKIANIVVWSDDPLEFSTQVDRVFVQGQSMPLVSRQTELRERYRNVPPQ